jgi:hypothetical protein
MVEMLLQIEVLVAAAEQAHHHHPFRVDLAEMVLQE